MDDTAFPFRVVRHPGVRKLAQLVKEADVIHVAGPAFLPMLIGLILSKPVVVEHSGYQSVCPNGMLLYGPTGSNCSGHFMARRYHKCLRCNAQEMGWTFG